MPTTKRPSGYSEIVNPTPEQIADLQARKESGELARLIFDRTTRGRVRAVWFRKAAKKPVDTGAAPAIAALTVDGHQGLRVLTPREVAAAESAVDRMMRVQDDTSSRLPPCVRSHPGIQVDAAPAAPVMTMDGRHMTPLAFAAIEGQRQEIEAEIKRQEQIDEPDQPFLDTGTIIRSAAVAFIISVAFFYLQK